MSKLRSKLASIENNANKEKKMKKQRKCASTLDVTFTGYRAENEEGMEIYMETSDPELRQKIKDNSLSEGERNFLISMAGEYFEKVVVPLIPMGKLIQPEDIAETVLFLASEQARMITGQVIKVSGGKAL